MGGFGSMLHASISTKNNLKLIKSRRRQLKKELSSQIRKTNYDFANVSKDELYLIKKNIRRKIKKEQRNSAIIVFFITTIIVFTIIYLFKTN